MPNLIKSTVLGLGLLAGVAVSAHAQSVSTLQPTSPATAAPPPVTSSTQSFAPNPGNNSAWKEQHYQPASDYDADKSQHPYSTSIGPQPGSHSSGKDVHYQATDADNDAARHPYTAPGMGPKPN